MRTREVERRLDPRGFLGVPAVGWLGGAGGVRLFQPCRLGHLVHVR